MPKVETIRFRAGEATLEGTLVVPHGEGRHPWAVLVPSWLPRSRDGGWDLDGHATWFAAAETPAAPLARLASALADRGVATLRFDPRGCGASDGTWSEVDLFTRIDDARDAIGAMRSRAELDLRRTAIVGHGEGATVALSVAIGDPAIGAVGLLAPAARSLRDVWRRGVAARARTGADRAHPIVDALDRASEELLERAERREASLRIEVAGVAVAVRLAAWEQGIHTPPLALATMLHRPVVLAHGADDAWTDADESRLLEQELRDAGNDPELRILDGVGHDLAEASDRDIGGVADALASRMLPRALPPVLLAIEEMGSDG